MLLIMIALMIFPAARVLPQDHEHDQDQEQENLNSTLLPLARGF